jgi:hypothetical protein
MVAAMVTMIMATVTVVMIVSPLAVMVSVVVPVVIIPVPMISVLVIATITYNLLVPVAPVNRIPVSDFGMMFPWVALVYNNLIAVVPVKAGESWR